MSVFGFLLTSRIARALSPIDAVGSLSNNRFIHTHTLSLSLPSATTGSPSGPSVRFFSSLKTSARCLWVNAKLHEFHSSEGERGFVLKYRGATQMRGSEDEVTITSERHARAYRRGKE